MKKWCSGCAANLDVSRFARNATRIDGLQSRCRTCSAVMQRNAKRPYETRRAVPAEAKEQR